MSLRIGDLVPADLRLLTVDELECDEGVLTGESMPVAKSAAPVAGRQPLDQPGCAFMGTIVHQGSAARRGGRGPGPAPRSGRSPPACPRSRARPRSRSGCRSFSRFLFAVAAVLTAFIFIVNVALSRPLIDALLFSLAIAVGIAPEMMPAIVTVSLSAGSKALAAKKVLVKRLVAIEDLGNIEILFTDKTGTLTEGVITFERGPRRRRAGRATARCCSGSSATKPRSPPTDRSGETRWTRRCGRHPGARSQRTATAAAAWQRLGVLPFDHERQLASVLVKDPGGQPLLITKGAPEVVLDRCVHVPDGARPTLEALFSEGARVVAVATRPAEGSSGAHRRRRAGADAGRAS